MKTSLLVTAAAAMVTALSLSAQSVDDIRAEAARIAERAGQAKREGRMDEARELGQQAEKLHRELREREGGKDGGDKAAAIKREVEELHRAGKHDEAERLQRRLSGMHAHQGHDKKTAGAEGPQRLQHLVEAIRHLHQAGFGRQAEELEKLAAHLKEEMMRDEMRARGGAGPEALEKIVAAHKAEVQAMREEMQKMARAVEELRGQVQSLKAAKPDGAPGTAKP